MQTYHLYDGLGSTSDLTDGSGNVVASYGYDVFGPIPTQTGSSPNYWLFTGEQMDATALQYLRARYYDPAIGRFLGQDPLPFLNRYTYVGNNPVNFVDPRGLFSHPDLTPDFVDDAFNEGKKFVTETVPRAAEWTVNQAAKGGKWVYQNAVVPVANFLASCEGKLLIGGLAMATVGIGAMGLGAYAVAYGGVHAATAGGAVIWGGGFLAGMGGLALVDACFGTDERFGLRQADAFAGDAGKE